MARDVSRRHKQREEMVVSALLNKKESARPRPRDSDVGMLPRLFVRIGVAALIVVLGTFVMVMQQQATPPTRSHTLNPTEKVQAETRASRRATVYPMVEVVDKYPHDSTAFTQGFTVINRDKKKIFIESTGLYGKSSLRQVDIESGNVMRQYDLPKELFGEGVTLGPKDELIMLTWKSKIGLVFDLKKTVGGKIDDFTVKRDFKFDTVTGEGWGVTYDGKDLIVSDGSSTIMFWDPSTMKETRRVDVTIYDGEQEIPYINELEVAKGFIYANVWYQPYILKINPTTGAAVTMFDMSKLVADVGVDVTSGAVLNGIAYDDKDDVFYVTGKHWNFVYKVRLVE
ncbi:hypothetical protein DD238_000702 [Peronospora effusa]|uniref:Glutamine cyclotransferase n=1 Tax=Peronospora effusa TaxID=542832 RepID=A0A3M6VUI2_9STRA|nr:hypothetical protein DD238_000702 [Peronospora effusa]